jgi:hypothetical protein
LFSIHSVNSDRELIFSSHKGDYFQVELKGHGISALTDVWAYTDANGLNKLFQELAHFQKPWLETLSWQSLEGEFTLSATCATLGQVTFNVTLCHRIGASESWKVEAGLVAELGQLEKIAKDAKAFFLEESA